MIFWCKTFILKGVHESCWHFCQMQFKVKSAWENRAVLIQYLQSDEMLTDLMSMSLFYSYFCNLWYKKSLTTEKGTILSGQMLYHVCIVHSRNAVYHFTKAQKLWECNAWNKSTVSINHITGTACVSWEGFALRYDIHSTQGQFIIGHILITCILIN